MEKGNWNNEFVKLASGLGLCNAQFDLLATWNEYFVLGYLIDKWYTDDYQKKGYVEADSCDWSGSGLEREEVEKAIFWLAINEYIDKIWLDDSHSRLAYKVSEWVLEKIISRTLSLAPGKAELVSLKQKNFRLEQENFRLEQENYQLRKENERLKRDIDNYQHEIDEFWKAQRAGDDKKLDELWKARFAGDDLPF